MQGIARSSLTVIFFISLKAIACLNHIVLINENDSTYLHTSSFSYP